VIVVSSLSLIEQNRLLTLEVKRRVDQMAAINMVAATVGTSLDLNRTLETALQAVVDVVGAEAGGISLIDDITGDVVLRAQRGWLHDFVNRPMRIPFGKGMSGQVISSNDVVVYNNLTGQEEFAFPSFSDEQFRSLAMAPMHARSKIIGILSIMSFHPNKFDDDIVNVLRAVADTVGVAIGNSRLYADSVEQRQRVTAILESTADGIIATDQDGRISLVNHAAETFLDISESEVLGVPVREAPIPQPICDLLLQALASRDTPSDQRAANKAFQITLPNARNLSLMVSPVVAENEVDQSPNQDGWVIVLQDITHLRQAEIARAQFMQAAAHDMRNPLSVTMSSLTMLNEMIKRPTRTIKELLGLANISVRRLQALIDDLLHLEHIESGYNFEKTAVDLNETLREVCEEISPLMAERSITLTRMIDPHLPAIQGDMRWIKRALHNYLENAQKYSPVGEQITLKAFIDEAGENVLLEVTDNGSGIPISAQSRLFERFFRVDENSEVKGSGLGLAIVKSVAEAHQGRVYVRSKPGQGSTFGIALPLAAAPVSG
jgi:PAS domain S-box-containing protein